jgi:ATP-dependent Clp protease ATP-binding subunit ClpC
MQDALGSGMGFGRPAGHGEGAHPSRLETIAVRAARRNFSPEFMNRLDAVVTYQPLSTEALQEILDIQLRELQKHIELRLGAKAFRVDVTARGRLFLLSQGTSMEYGAREIRRALHRHVTQPLATMIAEGRARPGGRIRIDAPGEDGHLQFRAA